MTNQTLLCISKKAALQNAARIFEMLKTERHRFFTVIENNRFVLVDWTDNKVYEYKF